MDTETTTKLNTGRRRTAKVGMVLAALVVVTAGHFLIGRNSHSRHVVHIILASLYLLPIIAAAVWFSWRGSLTATLLSSAAYYLHIRMAWAGQPMENAHQLALVAIFWVMGIVAALLVETQRRERNRRLAAEEAVEREAAIEAIAGLSNALRARDEYTREHSDHVALLAVAVGREQGLPPERLNLLRLAALVHDIGKIGIRDDVLFKPDQLTPAERAQIENHPVIAAKILRPIRAAREIAHIVLTHHETPDGTGYPQGLMGPQIPPETHILRVADVYASLTEQRPYKAAMPPDLALQVMQSWAGSKLDSASFGALQKVLGGRGAKT